MMKSNNPVFILRLSLSVKVTIWSCADKQLTDKSRDSDRRTNRGTEKILNIELWGGWWLRGVRSKAGEI